MRKLFVRSNLELPGIIVKEEIMFRKKPKITENAEIMGTN